MKVANRTLILKNIEKNMHVYSGVRPPLSKYCQVRLRGPYQVILF